MAVTGPGTAVFQQVPGASALPLTLAAWVKVPHAATPGTDHVLKLAQSSNNGVATLHYVPGGSDPDNFACGADWAAWNGTADCSAIGLVVRSGTWTLLVGTFDDGGTGNLQTIKIYVNGTLNNTSSGNNITGVDTAPADFTANIFAGDAGGAAAVAFPAIWQAVLTQAEVTALTAGQDPRVVHPANLKCLCALSPLKGSVTSQTDLISLVPWVGSAGFSFVADPPVLYWPPPAVPTTPGGPIPGPPLYKENVPGFKAPTSFAPPGQTTVTQGLNPVTGRYEIYRNGYRIAVAKTSSHASEIAAQAALNWPNTYQPSIVTTFEAVAGA